MYNEFERTRDTVIRHLKISDSSPSIPTGQSTKLPASLNPAAVVMRSVNVIANEISLPTSAYLDMCKQLNSPFWSSIVLNMIEKGRREWSRLSCPPVIIDRIIIVLCNLSNLRHFEDIFIMCLCNVCTVSYLLICMWVGIYFFSNMYVDFNMLIP
jgi:hypothetical protein